MNQNMFGSSFDYEGRLNKLRKLMDERDIDVTLVHSWTNQYYVSGMFQYPWYPMEADVNSEAPVIIFRDKGSEPVFLITWITSNGVKEATWIKDVRVVNKEPYGKLGWWEYMAEALREKGVDKGTIGIEEDACVVSTFTRIQSALPKAQFKRADELFRKARMIKEPEEIEIIKESVLIGEAGMKAGMEAAKVGVLEDEIQRAAEMEMKRRGAIREVESMCQAGIRTANHRALGTNWKRVEENELVAIDLGAVYKGYGCDICRTWVVGKPTETYNKIATDIAKIHEKILDFMKPGLTIGEIIEFGANDMRKAGYSTDRLFMPTTGTGEGAVKIHGIGLGPMHDPPDGDREVKLESGMTLAISGVVRYANFTIRYEDDVLVVPTGVELINKQIPWKL